MPRLGMTMREGCIVAWPVAVGERVEKGRPVLVIESEKAEVEVEASASGVLRHTYVSEGETVACGTLLAAITSTADEPFDAAAFRALHDRPEPVAPPVPTSPSDAIARPSNAGRPVAPAARALAKTLGIDPAEVPGTGPGGRVTREDVAAWAARRDALVPVAAGVALEVVTQGAGDAVVLLPGFGAGMSAFARQVPALAERWCVVGVHPRGVGLSDAPVAERYDVAVAAADVAVAVGRPAHVIGASFGAAVALELALARPELVRSLALITPFVEAGARLLAVCEAWCRVAAEACPETLASVLLPWMFSPAYLADAAARERSRRGLAASAAYVPAATLARTLAGLRVWSGTRRGDLDRVTVPTLVVVAGDDLLTPDGVTIAAAIAGARSIVVPGAGHAVALEAPEAVNAALVEHLARAGRAG
jgi:pyruvate dehydrogenase E2 component (dihydrolipoamide acetyltransferase)